MSNNKGPKLNSNVHRISKLLKYLIATMLTFGGSSENCELFEDFCQTNPELYFGPSEEVTSNLFPSSHAWWCVADFLNCQQLQAMHSRTTCRRSSPEAEKTKTIVIFSSEHNLEKPRESCKTRSPLAVETFVLINDWLPTRFWAKVIS